MATEEENKKFGIAKSHGVVGKIVKSTHGKLVLIENGKEIIIENDKPFPLLNSIKVNYAKRNGIPMNKFKIIGL